ncbi:hypothetical protein [Ruegeria atlantica]|uniref:Secreted protein n=1 Tax=Ruegeria atlantica TaxID=81569 RepID=A0A0P1EC40_9RHOB|nr:hypothetical protein [Ruegeria atlantica]CUH46632.1 hypothetical protein RUA4292_00798 [Ruegeria atlantica]
MPCTTGRLPSFLRNSLSVYLICLSVSTSQALGAGCPEKPELSGSVTFTGETRSLFIGVRQGQGVLELEEGQEFTFSARGLKFGETGTRDGTISGNVYGLQSPDDFPGLYQGVVGGFLAIAGESDIVLVNSKCVTIVARVSAVGLNMSLEADQAVIIQFTGD